MEHAKEKMREARIAVFVRGGVVQEVASDSANVLIKRINFDDIEEGDVPGDWQPPDLVLPDPQDFDRYTSGGREDGTC